MMKLDIEPGKYVLAVSGGVDSIVLLNMLSNMSGISIVVAHFDHGIRPDSSEDRKLVQEAAARYNVPFVYEEGKLGLGASEATARIARYGFLQKARRAAGAQAIVTAHHQDDALETAILNIIRGTGRKGLTSLSSTATTMRPMLHLAKANIIKYAEERGLKWREDSTNFSDKYLRNYIRHHVLPRFSGESRAKLLDIIAHMRSVNDELDNQLINMMHLQPSQGKLSRAWFTLLNHIVAKEFLASWLRANGITNFDAKTLERVVIAAKINQPGSAVDIAGNTSLAIEKHRLALVANER